MEQQWDFCRFFTLALCTMKFYSNRSLFVTAVLIRNNAYTQSFAGEVPAGPTLWQVFGNDHRQLFTAVSSAMTVTMKRAMTSWIKKAGGNPVPPTVPLSAPPNHYRPTDKAPCRCSRSCYTWYSSQCSRRLEMHIKWKRKTSVFKWHCATNQWQHSLVPAVPLLCRRSADRIWNVAWNGSKNKKKILCGRACS